MFVSKFTELDCLIARLLLKFPASDSEHGEYIYFLYPSASELDIAAWLNHMELDSYLNEFKREGIHTVKDLRAHEISDDLLDALEVMIPGHRKRIKTGGKCLHVNSILSN